jgi:predicted DNA-binding protein
MKATKKLHVPLTAELHGSLQQISSAVGKPATVVAREAIEEHLKRLKKSVIDESIQRWALEVSGTDLDLDPELEEAAVDFLAEFNTDA